MIRFFGKFKIDWIGYPKNKEYGKNFWCSFNTKKQLIMCSVIYMGKDKYMKQSEWYKGIIELPYGEKFPPYCQEITKGLEEEIFLNQYYDLNVGGTIVGKCKLEMIKEIIYDDFDIRKDENGNY